MQRFKKLTQTLLKTGLLFVVIFDFGTQLKAQVKENSLKLISVQKIWDASPHNAFTDLIWHKGRFFCVFREGATHVSPDGALQVITSVDGEKWESAALITSENSDLRDAKITVTPSGKLMLSGAEALHDKSVHTHQSLVWFSEDGKIGVKNTKLATPISGSGEPPGTIKMPTVLGMPVERKSC
jgi:hypothetical protein